MNFKTIFSIFAVLILVNCTQKGAMEDVTTGLYEQGGMSYLDKDGEVPAKIYFDYNQYSIDDMDSTTLDLQATWLDENPSRYILIEGHCDERGTREYNLALGERRANTVKDYLMTYGISGSRLSVISYGKERPVNSGSNPLAWSQNRRSVTVKAN